MHDRPKIRERRAAGGSIRGIARGLGASRNAVRRALDPDARDRYHRHSRLDDVEPAVRDVLADYPRLTVEEIGELVEWDGSRRSLSNLVARLRPIYLEREVEDLPRPTLGEARIGTVRLGRMTVGTLTVGRAHGGEGGAPVWPQAQAGTAATAAA